MKNINLTYKKTAYYILFILIISFNSCKKTIKGCKNPSSLNYNKDATEDNGTCQIIDPNQRYFLMEIGATFCAPCGSYGMPSLQKAIETVGTEKIVGMAVHSGWDPLTCQAGMDLINYAQYYDVNIPRFAGASNTLFVGVNRDVKVNVDRIKTEAEKVISLKPVVNSFIQKTISDSFIHLEITTKFNVKTNGTYYLAAYVLEDGIIEPQLMRNPAGSDTIKKDMVHNHVLRGAFGPTFGLPLASGNIIQGKQIVSTYKTPINNKWVRNKLHYAIIIWKKDINGIYKFENCSQI